MESFELVLSKLSKPAQRAIQNQGLKSLQDIATLTEKEFLSLHGIGIKSISVIETALSQVGLSFKK